jgi:hypothetical protein
MGATGRLRRCLLLLAVLGVAGTAIELAMLRHWNTFVQLIPWFALAVIAGGIALVATRPNSGRIRLVRVLAVAVFLIAAFGVFEHTVANYDAGPLDFRYATKWAAMSTTSRWWAAFTESVGPSPSLAPLVLAWSALCVVFATLDHPALERQ